MKRKQTIDGTPGRLMALVLLTWLSVPAQARECVEPMGALVRLAAERIDSTLRDVAASTRALGESYQQVAAVQKQVTAADRERWLGKSRTQGRTMEFRTWPEALKGPPAFQAPFPGLYSYNADSLSDANVRHLEMFETLAPLFRAAYRSFDFSWVYLTTADNMMLIYPYLPMDEAVNNDPPTAQIYYKAADVEHRQAGWTLPYLDLVGAGLMVTVSYPIITDGRLLGVASRDITLEQLSRSVLEHLASEDGVSALIVDQRGLAIAASDTDLAAELQAVNTKANAPVLYYRSAKGLKDLEQKDAVASRFDWVNNLTEQVIGREAKPGESGIVAFDANGRHVLAAPIPSTAWYVIMAIAGVSADS